MDEFGKVKAYIATSTGLLDAILETICLPLDFAEDATQFAEDNPAFKKVGHLRLGCTLINAYLTATHYYIRDTFLRTHSVFKVILWIFLTLVIAALAITLIVLLPNSRKRFGKEWGKISPYFMPIMMALMGVYFFVSYASNASKEGEGKTTKFKNASLALAAIDALTKVLGIWKFEPLKKYLVAQMGPFIAAFPITKGLLYVARFPVLNAFYSETK